MTYLHRGLHAHDRAFLLLDDAFRFDPRDLPLVLPRKRQLALAELLAPLRRLRLAHGVRLGVLPELRRLLLLLLLVPLGLDPFPLELRQLRGLALRRGLLPLLRLALLKLDPVITSSLSDP